MTARLTIRWLGILLALAPLGAEIIDRIAVSVGNQVITAGELDREIRVTAFLNGVKPDLSAANRRATAERMVEQALVRKELDSSRYPVPAAQDIEPALAALKKSRAENDAAFQNACAADGITEQDVRDELLWQRTLLQFIELRFRPAVQVSEQDIQDYFKKVVQPAARAAHPNQTPALEDYHDQIEETLTGQREDKEMDTWLKEARNRTEIVFHDEVFQ